MVGLGFKPRQYGPTLTLCHRLKLPSVPKPHHVTCARLPNQVLVPDMAVMGRDPVGPQGSLQSDTHQRLEAWAGERHVTRLPAPRDGIPRGCPRAVGNLNHQELSAWAHGVQGPSRAAGMESQFPRGRAPPPC